MIETVHLTTASGGQLVHADLVSLTVAAGEVLDFRCLRKSCGFHREFSTLAGAKRYIGEHLYLRHQVRVFWKESA